MSLFSCDYCYHKTIIIDIARPSKILLIFDENITMPCHKIGSFYKTIKLIVFICCPVLISKGQKYFCKQKSTYYEFV